MSGRRVYDPSKLHLKKELTQIKKSAKALRDPGTSSSLRSPLSATRSATTAVFAQKSRLQNSPFSVTCKGNERSVLYNWKGSNKKSSSEKSFPGVDLNGGKGSSFNSSSDARNGVSGGDSKVNTYVDDIINGRVNQTMRFRCGSIKLASIGSPLINSLCSSGRHCLSTICADPQSACSLELLYNFELLQLQSL